MNLSAGIVGLPNVGKSTLFNTITNSKVEAANYPFATIEPNVGVVNVPDSRLDELGSLINPEKLVHATCKFVDIAGLVKGASNGEGLGNKFLQNIREVDTICHVVRCFDDKNILHVYNSVDPIRDVEIINLELALSDIEQIEKRILKLINKSKSGDQQATEELALCEKVKNNLQQGKLALSVSYSNKEKEILKNYNLLTLKPIIYIANLNESDIVNPNSNVYYLKLKEYALKNSASIIPLSISMEYEISLLNELDKKIFLEDIGIKEPGLNLLIKTTYRMLNLSTFFTFGKKETKAWTFINGMLAPQCAGIIHSDFERGFIKAEIIKANDLLKYKSELLVRENGKIHIEGKDYVVQDGDVCHFKFNI